MDKEEMLKLLENKFLEAEEYFNDERLPENYKMTLAYATLKWSVSYVLDKCSEETK